MTRPGFSKRVDPRVSGMMTWPYSATGAPLSDPHTHIPSLPSDKARRHWLHFGALWWAPRVAPSKAGTTLASRAILREFPDLTSLAHLTTSPRDPKACQPRISLSLPVPPLTPSEAAQCHRPSHRAGSPHSGYEAGPGLLGSSQAAR